MSKYSTFEVIQFFKGKLQRKFLLRNFFMLGSKTIMYRPILYSCLEIKLYPLLNKGNYTLSNQKEKPLERTCCKQRRNETIYSKLY